MFLPELLQAAADIGQVSRFVPARNNLLQAAADIGSVSRYVPARTYLLQTADDIGPEEYMFLPELTCYKQQLI